MWCIQVFPRTKAVSTLTLLPFPNLLHHRQFSVSPFNASRPKLVKFSPSFRQKIQAKLSSLEPKAQNQILRILESRYIGKRKKPSLKGKKKTPVTEPPAEIKSADDETKSTLDPSVEKQWSVVRQKLQERIRLESSRPVPGRKIHAPLGGHIGDLQFWDLYPLQVKKWVLYTKTPKGSYSDIGKWASVPDDELPPFPFGMRRGPDAQRLSKLTKRDQEAALEKLYQKEQAELDPDLRGKFRFGIQASELDGLSIKLKRLFSFTFATESEIRNFRKAELIKKWAEWDGDTGTPPCQIAALSVRIANMETKLATIHRKDEYNRYRLKRLARRRKAIMALLKRKDCATYYKLVKELNIRDSVAVWKYPRY